MFRRFVLALVATSVMLVGGCSGPKQYMPAADLALGALELAAQPGIESAVESGSMTKCIGWFAMREAAGNLRDYAKVVEQSDSWLPELPAVSLQYADCAPLQNHDGTWRPVLPDVAKPILNGLVLPALKMLEAQANVWIADADIPCRTKVWLSAVVPYMEGLIGAVLLELSEPDGEFSLEASPLDFSPCST